MLIQVKSMINATASTHIQPLTVGAWNSVVTSSIDRTVKVWNMNYIFEQVHHIDRHELQIDSVSLCTR